MKTTSYNTASEIRTGIIMLVFATALFAAFKVKELQVNDTNGVERSNTNRIEVNSSSYSSSPVLDAKLMEEPAPKVKALMSNVEYSAQKYAEAEIDLETQNWLNKSGQSNETAYENVNLLRIEAMMNSLKYDAKEFVDHDMEAETQVWMNSPGKTNEVANENESLPVIEAKMNSLKYDAKEFADQEMEAETQNWINNPTYRNTEVN
jgi:hypothetical protein